MDDKATAERKQMDAHDLWREVGRFISDNRSSHNIDRRWLASAVAPVHALLEAVKMSGVDGLPESHQLARRDFRLQEIEDAKAHLARETQALDQEAQKLRLQTIKAA